MPMRSFRATDEEIARWQAAAERLGLTFSELVRQGVDQRIGGRGRPSPAASCTNRVPSGAFCRQCGRKHP